MILMDHEDLAWTCRSLRNLCFEEARRFVHERIGWNLRMTNLQAALGLAQLERLDEFLQRKIRMGKLYTELLSNIECLQLPAPSTAYANNNYWVYGILLRRESNMSAPKFTERLRELGIGTRPFFCPMHMQPVLRRQNLFDGQRYPIAEDLYTNGFYIPSGLGLSEAEIHEVATAVRKVLRVL